MTAKSDVTIEGLRKYCYFSGLSEHALRTIARSLEAVEKPAGTVIIREGTPGEDLFFLAAGEVAVTKTTPLRQTAILSVMKGSDIFGEMALLTGSLRAATVTAQTDVVLLRLPKAVFEHVVLGDSTAMHLVRERAAGYAHFDRIKALEPFARLDPAQVAVLMQRMREERFGPEHDIVTQGNKGDTYYIIKSGSVGVIKQPPEGRAALVAVLGEGEGFGEEALLTASARSATVRTIEETVVWVLDKADFSAILRPTYLEECTAEELALRRKEAGGFALLDVRTPMEFEEEYIPEAINLPLDQLRRKYADLDPEKFYGVCCLSGARSAVAAFLLRMHGLKAVNIKGGLLQWRGPLVTGPHAGIHQPHPSS